MLRRTFINSLITSLYTASLKASTMKSAMNSKIRLLRHATLVIEINNLKILVDPMLSSKDKMDPVQNCGNDIRIPMVGLPINKTELDQLLNEVDAVIVTHLHRDHWDVAAQNLIHKSKTIFCQPGDSVKLTEQGFKNVIPIQSNLSWKRITIHRTPGQHGTGDIGKKMGEVSGFILASAQNSIYVAGDTIWCNEVEETLTNFNPEVIVVNAGGAKFLSGDPITMTPDHPR